nr:type VI secretion protein IcmF/TssM N-terminal domain-containing protein [uncultured Pseudomonas sp.]
MLKKLSIALLWLLALLVLAGACWVATVFAGWPLWYAPLLFIGVLLAGLLLQRIVQRWHGWRLRRRMQRGLPERMQELAPDVDQSWNHGVRLLQQSRLGRVGSALYALPWFLMLGESGSGKSTLLTRSGLATPLRSVSRSDVVLPTDTLDWWFFERAVVIDLAGRMLNGGVAWKRLLYWLLRSRRREPLNGVVMTIDAASLLGHDKERLTELGRRLRQHLDDLVKVFGARLPVYLVVTGGEHIPGLREWAGLMSEEQREQPFGLLSNARNAGAGAFLDDVFGELERRLFELRIELGQRALPEPAALHFPERVAALRAQLEHLLLPAFDSNPYSEPPLLGGLFITAVGDDAQGADSGWFSRDLFDQLLPAQRHAYTPIDSWRHWRRLLTHAAVVLWLAGCVGLALLLFYADGHVRTGFAQATQNRPTGLNFDAGLGTDLDALRRYHQYVETLEDFDEQRWKRWLPFHKHIDAVLRHERAEYVRAFAAQIQGPVFAQLLANNLPRAAASDDDRLIAAYTELLVRRINLIDARLNGQPLDPLPGPDDELLPLFNHLLPPQAPTVLQAQSLSDSYKAYLTWQTDTATLRSDRANAARQLDSLGLANRPLSWLVTWAEQQTNLPTIRYSDYMEDPDQPNAALPRAFTVEGRAAILGFIDELIAATRSQAMWKDQRERFLTRYNTDTQDAWYRFIEGYLLVDQKRMASQAEWREILSGIGSNRDPYRKLLQRSAQRLALVPAAERNLWANLAVRLDRLLTMADDAAINDDQSLIERLRVANQLGGEALKGIASSGSVSKGVNEINGDMAQAKVLAQFEQKLRGVVIDLQRSDAQAFQVALDSWGFGSDPAVKAAPLWEARDLRDGLQRQLQSDDARESVVWTLATGGLEFATAYAGQIAACRIQQDWNGQVLGAVEGVRDPVLISELLYGERGQLPLFLNGPVKTFMQREAQGFTTRMALGQEVPLTPAFLAYAGRMIHTQTDLASVKRQSTAQQAAQQADKQTLEAEQKTLQAQQAALQMQLPKLLATTSVVDLQAAPPSINLGARQLPQQTRLTLQCNNRSTVLDNYNFPTSASFVWGSGICSDVSLEISFPNYTLNKRWSGERGFIDFLRTFNGGQHTFGADDFPNQRQLMGSDNITALTLTYRQQGEQALLSSYQQADALQAQSDALDQRLKALAEQLAAIDTQARNSVVEETAQGSVAEQRVAAVTPPAQVAWCWAAPPQSTSPATNAAHDEVEVGVFSDAQRVGHLQKQLKAMHFDTRQETLADQRIRVIVIDLAGAAGQRQAIERIARQLALKARPWPAGRDASAE